MDPQEDRRRPAMLNIAPSRSSSADSFSTTTSYMKPPRTARFAEATAVHSPVEGRAVFAQDGTDTAAAADVGFGYIGDNKNKAAVQREAAPLKSAMKLPGSWTSKTDNPLSPTFREEDVLEKREVDTDKEQARDLRVKTRVRLAKLALRGVSFSCSLIVLGMLTSSFAVFNATKALPAQSGLPPWATNTNPWPQIVVLAAACVSLAICLLVFVAYCRGGHHRAEKVGVYYTLFALGYFIFSMVIWATSAAVMQHTKNSSDNKDMWGWACVQNHRADLFQDKIDYALVCRLQNWTLICIIIEIVVEVISITLYSIVFYRYYTKRRLTKSMDMRDRARTDMYLAQLRSQSAPNTPGFGPKSPSFSQHAMSPRFPPSAYTSLADVAGQAPSAAPTRVAGPHAAFASALPRSPDKPFSLMAPPKKAPRARPNAPAPDSDGRTPPRPTASPPRPSHPPHRLPGAPAEGEYAAVPIPEPYPGAAVKSQTGFGLTR